MQDGNINSTFTWYWEFGQESDDAGQIGADTVDGKLHKYRSGPKITNRKCRSGTNF